VSAIRHDVGEIKFKVKFMSAITLLTRLPPPDMSAAELTHIDRNVINMRLAHEQHAGYCEAIRSKGFDVVLLDSMPDYPDSVFVEDVMISRPEFTIICRPGTASRRGEVEGILPNIPKDRPHYTITAKATLEGGDVLCVGRTLYVGQSTRTNKAGIEQLRNFAVPHGYDVHAIKTPGALHLKTAVTALDDKTLVANPRWIDMSDFKAYKIIEVADGEDFSGNCLNIAGHLFLEKSNAKTTAKLKAHGFDVTPIDISEFAKAEAGLTCMSVAILPSH
jgi:dimethylargininase